MSNVKKWTKKDIEFLKKNFIKMTYKELGIHLNRTESSVRAKCYKLNLSKKSCSWTDEEINYLLNNYQNITYRDIARHLNRSLDAVRSKASKYSLNKKHYYCEYNYFESIDNEYKSYWLGFIFADGWIYAPSKNKTGCIGIELKQSDIDHLRRFNKDISGNYKISTRIRNTNFKKSYKSCYIRIYSRKIAEDLINLGAVPNKSLIKKFPDCIPQNLIRHFIRGYFDGNGCVRASKDKSNHIISVRYTFYSGSKDFISSLRDILITNNIFCSEILQDTDSNGNKKKCYRFDVYSNHLNSLSLYSYMYDNSNVFLNRKYKKSKYFFNILNNKHSKKNHTV